jgi:uncharacterized protein (DUF924 family)
MAERIDEILQFWFGEDDAATLAQVRRWFEKDAAFDAEIRARFGEDIERALAGSLDAWSSGAEGPRGRLAFVVLADQLTRNVFRGTPGSFSGDARALAACLGALAAGAERSLSPLQRYVLFMPMMHAEDRAVQQRAVASFDALAAEAEAAGAAPELTSLLRSAHDYALRHAAIVERFGRFPHRNELLGRASTEEEAAFLKEPGSSF